MKKKNGSFLEIFFALYMGISAGISMAAWLLSFMYFQYWKIIVGVCVAIFVLLTVVFFFIIRAFLKPKTQPDIRPQNIRYCVKKDFDLMDGEEFEKFCAYVIQQNGYEEVRITKGSGDHGIDIFAKKEGLLYAIQCKRYSNSVGNKAIQEIFSGKAIYHADKAVVMTNSFFTKQAIEDAKKLEVYLWDRNIIISLMKSGNIEVNKNSIEEEQSHICPKCGETMILRESSLKKNYYACWNPDCDYFTEP